VWPSDLLEGFTRKKKMKVKKKIENERGVYGISESNSSGFLLSASYSVPLILPFAQSVVMARIWQIIRFKRSYLQASFSLLLLSFFFC
jgi:hypothetical protein